MEMPVKVVVVLFVAMIVGMSIITFSKKIISDSKENIQQIGEKGKDSNNFIELNSINSESILHLADQCYNDKYGNAFEKTLCFVIHSNNPINPAELNAIDSSTYNSTDLTGANSIFIYYDPVLGNVNITT